MSAECKFITKKELCERWGVTSPTIEKWLNNKIIKTFRNTNFFSVRYVETIETENINLDEVSAFTLRAKDRQIEQLEKERAVLRSCLLQANIVLTERLPIQWEQSTVLTLACMY